MRDWGHIFIRCHVVNSNKHTTWHISKNGWYLHLKMMCSENATIIWRNTTSQPFLQFKGIIIISIISQSQAIQSSIINHNGFAFLNSHVPLAYVCLLVIFTTHFSVGLKHDLMTPRKQGQHSFLPQKHEQSSITARLNTVFSPNISWIFTNKVTMLSMCISAAFIP